MRGHRSSYWGTEDKLGLMNYDSPLFFDLVCVQAMFTPRMQSLFPRTLTSDAFIRWRVW